MQVKSARTADLVRLDLHIGKPERVAERLARAAVRVVVFEMAVLAKVEEAFTPCERVRVRAGVGYDEDVAHGFVLSFSCFGFLLLSSLASFVFLKVRRI